ncbi:ACP synthase [Candidatus Woesearchaeota archaeon CG10_big_fil_rev_8_21_14_0_10_30_7]|nr:MAG: ACP synthase [Candidatus Woesearchaeota archaeon CG10_big_fil_rev_8_21_14_0_10_30_7]
MKALSLKQPFAELIVSGKKTIELRNWNTKFRGEFIIHASKTLYNSSMEKNNFKTLPTGCIVGKATLVDVKHYINKEDFEKDRDKHKASSDWWNEKGVYGFILENAQRLPEKPLKGQLNFFEIKY